MSDGNSPRGRLGRPPLTSRTAILAAARDIGFAQLTVGAVTARVGVKYSTFYRHFPNLEALVTDMVEDVLDHVELPVPDGDWRAYLRRICTTLFDLFTDHPGLAEAVVGLATIPDRLFEVYRHICDVALAAGFAAEDAAMAGHAAIELVVAPWLTTDDHGTAMIQRRPHTATAAQLDPRVRAVVTGMIDDPPREWTARTIELLIAGLAARLPAS